MQILFYKNFHRDMKIRNKSIPKLDENNIIISLCDVQQTPDKRNFQTDQPQTSCWPQHSQSAASSESDWPRTRSGRPDGGQDLLQLFSSSGISLMADSQYNGETRVQVLLEYLQVSCVCILMFHYVLHYLNMQTDSASHLQTLTQQDIMGMDKFN